MLEELHHHGSKLVDVYLPVPVSIHFTNYVIEYVILGLIKAAKDGSHFVS
jgi:hypothetical protein